MYTWALVVFYLILSLLLGRRNNLYYLIFPFSLVQGPGAFIDPDAFYIGGLAFARDFILLSYLWLAITIGKSRGEVKNANRLILVYTGYLFILLMLTILKLGFSFRVLTIFRIFLYIPLYYYFFVRIFSSVSKDQFIEAVNAIFYVNILSAVLYILNSANIVPIFPFDPWIVIEEGARVFYRDLLTAPLFYSYVFLMALTMLFNKEYLGIRKLVVYINICLSIVVLFFTFTRGDVFNFIFIMIIMAFIHILYSQNTLINKMAAMVLALFMITTSWLVISEIFPNQMEYFLSRYTSLESGILQDGTFYYRIDLLNRAWDAISTGAKDILLFGTGFSQAEMSNMIAVSGSWMGDIMWPFFIIYNGLLGTFLFLGVIIAGIMTAFKYYIRSGNLWFEFIFLALIYNLLRSINGPGFNDATGLAMIPFALLTVESYGLWLIDEWEYYEEDEDVISQAE